MKKLVTCLFGGALLCSVGFAKEFSNGISSGGFEFQYNERNSFVVEYGGKYRYVIGENMASYGHLNGINPVIMIGFRSYLENRNKSR